MGSKKINPQKIYFFTHIRFCFPCHSYLKEFWEKAAWAAPIAPWRDLIRIGGIAPRGAFSPHEVKC